MAIAKIRKGDKVIVLSGKDKGRTGEVTKVSPKEGKLVVDGINVHAHHTKPSQNDPNGGIKRAAAPLHASKVALIDPKSGKATRVRIETQKDGTRVRVAVKSGEVI